MELKDWLNRFQDESWWIPGVDRGDSMQGLDRANGENVQSEKFWAGYWSSSPVG